MVTGDEAPRPCSDEGKSRSEAIPTRANAASGAAAELGSQSARAAESSRAPKRDQFRQVSIRRMWGAGPIVLLIGGIAGCAIDRKPIFEPLTVPLVWPAPPADARIRYIGSLHSSADLRPRRRAFAALGELLVGKKPPEVLINPRCVVSTRDAERIWIGDPGARSLHLFDLRQRSHKKITRFNGTPLLTPVGMCLGPGESIYVCDSERSAIHRFADRDGTWIETLRLPEELLRPVALHYEESDGELWVVDSLGHDVKVLGTDGSFQRIVGRRGTGPGEFNFPCDIAARGNRVWIADAGNHRVQAISREGESIIAFGQAGDASGDLALPKAVAVDNDGHVYVVDARFENIQVFDETGRLLLFLGEEGTGPGQFWLPNDVYIEPSGRIWVCDSYNSRVQVFAYAGDEPR